MPLPEVPNTVSQTWEIHIGRPGYRQTVRHITTHASKALVLVISIPELRGRSPTVQLAGFNYDEQAQNHTFYFISLPTSPGCTYWTTLRVTKRGFYSAL